MEKPDYYAHLELLYDHFGRDTVFVTLNQVAKFLHKDHRTLEADKTFPLKKIGRGATQKNVSLVSLARWMSA